MLAAMAEAIEDDEAMPVDVANAPGECCGQAEGTGAMHTLCLFPVSHKSGMYQLPHQYIRP